MHEQRPTSSSPPLTGHMQRPGSTVPRGGVSTKKQFYEVPRVSARKAAADIAWGKWPHTPRDFLRSPSPPSTQIPQGGNAMRFCDSGEPWQNRGESPMDHAEPFFDGPGNPMSYCAKPPRKRGVLPHLSPAEEDCKEQVEHKIEDIRQGQQQPQQHKQHNELVRWGEEDARRSRSGLGAIQPDGRAQVLQQWSKEFPNGDCPRAVPSQPPNPRSSLNLKKKDSKNQQQLLRQNLSQMTEAPGASLCVNQAYIKGLTTDGDGQKFEWSTLSAKSKHALWQWVIGQLGGRHCLMILEHDVAIDFLISPLDRDDVVMSDLRGGMVLNALSGLHGEASAAGSTQSEETGGKCCGGWLYKNVFAKSPARVLEDAFETALNDVAETWRERPTGLTVQHLNLSLKRQAMKTQAMGMQSLANASRFTAGLPRSSDEYLRVQIWLELLRLHVEGALGSAPPPAPQITSAAQSLEAVTAVRSGKGGSDPCALLHWDDTSVLTELGKLEADREAESKRMTLDALRIQNRSIEAYLMRLVRQRDTLKHITRLAEECDSYFVLGLDGPSVTEDEVKKAYRALARKEHPDKAGTENKGRFQEIQQAYAAVLQQRRMSATAEQWLTKAAKPDETSQAQEEEKPGCGAVSQEAIGHAETARDSADRSTSCAYQSFQLSNQCSQIRSAPLKKGALRELRDLAAQSVAQSRGAAVYLRSVKESSCAVARCARNALEKYGEFADLAISGAGLRERASLVHEAGQACLSIAEHLEKTSEVTELALQQVARHTQDRASSDGASLQVMRVLGDGLVRGAVVARCAADESISTATKALELSCSLVALDIEWQRQNDGAKKKGSDSPRVEKDSCDPSTVEAGADNKAKTPADRKDSAKENETNGRRSVDPKRGKPLGGKGSEERLGDIDRIKRQHISLRVKNLQCMGSLNEEVLQLQEQLRGMFKKAEGGLLPAISIAQKDGVFELVKQLLNAAFVEAGKLAADVSVPTKQVLEKSFDFALALEHTQEVALSAEVRTHVLKLAALVDLDLLCQIIDGPFRHRLLGLDTGRRKQVAASPVGYPRRQSQSCSRASMRATAPRLRCESSLSQTGTSESWVPWTDVVHSFCGRLLRCLHVPLAEKPSAEDTATDSL